MSKLDVASLEKVRTFEDNDVLLVLRNNELKRIDVNDIRRKEVQVVIPAKTEKDTGLDYRNFNILEISSGENGLYCFFVFGSSIHFTRKLFDIAGGTFDTKHDGTGTAYFSVYRKQGSVNIFIRNNTDKGRGVYCSY